MFTKPIAPHRILFSFALFTLVPNAFAVSTADRIDALESKALSEAIGSNWDDITKQLIDAYHAELIQFSQFGPSNKKWSASLVRMEETLTTLNQKRSTEDLRRLLGLINARMAIDPNKSMTLRIQHSKKARLLLSEFAQEPKPKWHLGYLRLHGVGEPRNQSTAMTMIREAADGYEPAAAYFISNHLKHSDPSAAFQYLRKSSIAGHVNAMKELANLYRLGRMTKPMITRAGWWQEQAKIHDGKLYPVDISNEPGEDQLPVASQLKDDTPSAILGDVNFKQCAHIEEALSTCTLQLNEKKPDQADLNLKGLYSYLDGDYRTSRKLFTRAVRHGSVPAIANLATMALNGEGQRTSVRKAIEMYKKAAAKGSYVAARNLADIYEFGIGVPIAPERADEWYARYVELRAVARNTEDFPG